MSGVVGNVEGHIKEIAKLFGWAWWVDMKQVVQAFCGCYVVGFRADAADSLGYLGHILSQPSFAELLKAPEFWHLEVRIFYLTCVIEEYLYFAMAFEPGDGVYSYLFHFTLALLNSESGKL
jgi:hypothetical protein